MTYGDDAPDYTYSVTSGNLCGEDAISVVYSCAYVKLDSVNGKVNDYTITITSATNSNYSITTQTGMLTVNKKAVSLIWKTDDGRNGGFLGGSIVYSYIYDKTAHYLVPSITLADGTTTRELSISTDYSNYIDVGTNYSVTATTKDKENNTDYSVNYEISNTTAEFNINRRPISIQANDITSSDAITYGDAVPTYSYTVISTEYGLCSVDDIKVTYNCSYAQYSDAGTYEISITSAINDNYEITYSGITIGNGTLTVNQKPITVTWGSDTTFTYDGKPHAPFVTAISGAISGYDPKVSVEGAETNASAQAYTATAVAGNPNYVVVSNDTQTKTFTISPKEISSVSVSALYYNGLAQTPEATAIGVSNETIYLTVTLSGTGGINAGTYTNATVTGVKDNTNYCIPAAGIAIEYTISKIEFKWSSDNISGANYSASGINIANILQAGYISGLDSSVYTAATLAELFTVSINDGNTGNKPIGSGASSIDGSTYKVTVTLTNAAKVNFTNPDVEILGYFKYKTAKIGSTYYTIEDAILAGANNIVLCGNATSATSYITTRFTGIDFYKVNGVKQTTYNLTGRTLTLPTDDSGSIGGGMTDRYTDNSSKYDDYVYSVLRIPNDITINCSNTTINVGGRYGFNNTHEKLRSVIVNNGIINLTNSSKIVAYGYIKGDFQWSKDNGISLQSGYINMASGTQITDIMTLYDYPGSGSNTRPIYNANVFPMERYSVHNVSCGVKIAKGAIYSVKGVIWGTSVSTNEFTAKIAGSNGLFEITSDDGFIIKHTNGVSNDETTHNQSETQRDCVTLYGNIKDNPLSIYAGATINTSTSLALPVGLMDINIYGGTTTLSASSYKFLPGSTLSINSSAMLIISGDAKMWVQAKDEYKGKASDSNPTIFKSKADAVCELKGTLQINDNASLAGNIKGCEGGKLILNGHSTATFPYMTSTGSSATSSKITCSSYGLNTDGTKYSFESGNTYKVYEDSGKFNWYKTGNITVTLKDQNGIFVKDFTVTAGSDILSSLNALGGVPVRPGYKTSEGTTGFYWDSGCNQAVVAGNIYYDATVYAWYDEDENVIKYTLHYKKKDGTILQTLKLVDSDFGEGGYTLSDVYLQGIPTGHKFTGWYKDTSLTNKVTSISADDFDTTNHEFVVYAGIVEKEYKLSITESNSTITVKVGEEKRKSGDTVKFGETLNITISYSQSSDRSFTINSDNKGAIESLPDYQVPDIGDDGTTLSMSATSSSGSICFVADTLVTMADGTQKRVDELKSTDLIMTFDHETGKYVSTPIAAIVNHGYSNYNVINVIFEDGTHLKFIGDHGLFDLDLMKYVAFREDNVGAYIGDSFVKYNESNEIITTKLIDVYISQEYNYSYSVFSAVNQNHIIENMLGISTGLYGVYNIYDLNEDMIINQEAKQRDIETYGLYSYDDWKDILSYELYYGFGFENFKVAIGKGLATEETYIGYIKWFYDLVEEGCVIQ